MACEEEPLVSMDFKGDTHSSVVDVEFTQVLKDNMAKVVAWYDNEWATPAGWRIWPGTWRRRVLGKEGGKVRILVIDDDAVACEFLQERSSGPATRWTRSPRRSRPSRGTRPL